MLGSRRLVIWAAWLSCSVAFQVPCGRVGSRVGLRASQLEQLAEMTTLSIDTGDLDVIERYGKTGLITDATTNPLFVAQAGTSGDARYVAFVDSAIAYAKAEAEAGDDVTTLAMDRLAVEFRATRGGFTCTSTLQSV